MTRGRRAEKEERTPQAASLKCRELPFCEFMSETFFPEMRSHLSVGDYLKRTCFVTALMCCSPAVPSTHQIRDRKQSSRKIFEEKRVQARELFDFSSPSKVGRS